ncbi:MAG: hypothetical protein LBP58_00620 [Azoarcus sp.]|nr:hypothetical protein [Azoarcus sp.]
MFFAIPRKRSIAACLAVTHKQATPRHCEARRAVAIQKAVQIVSALQETEPPHGLPRRCAPRNDECHHPNRKRSNARFAVAAREQSSAFVPWIGGSLDGILCEQFERTAGNDNCVRFEDLHLQIPAERHRCHYVKAKVRVHRYPDGALARPKCRHMFFAMTVLQ